MLLTRLQHPFRPAVKLCKIKAVALLIASDEKVGLSVLISIIYCHMCVFFLCGKLILALNSKVNKISEFFFLEKSLFFFFTHPLLLLITIINNYLWRSHPFLLMTWAYTDEVSQNTTLLLSVGLNFM
jgi:hypothetical protein